MGPMTTAEERTRQALLQAREAKDDVVSTHGIGSELAPAVYTWNDHGYGIAVLTQQPADPTDEHRRVVAAVMAFADGMGVNTATVIKEGFAAQRGTEADARPLAVRFASGDPTVHECITAVTATTDGDGAFAIQPYTVGLGRKVAWHDTLDLVAMRCDELPLTHLLRQALDPDSPTDVERALDALDDLGFAAMWSVRPAST